MVASSTVLLTKTHKEDKKMKRIGWIIGEILSIIVSAVLMLGTLVYSMEISEAKSKDEWEVLKYEGQYYERDKLIEKLSSDRVLVLVFLFIFIALTVFLFVMSSKRKKAAAASKRPAAPTVSAAAFCPKCGNARSGNEQFCGKCGNKF